MKDAKITVIGHTHHPYINTNVNNGKHIFIDSGDGLQVVPILL
ncbi:MAG: hypothetical protein M5T52_21040 [Ignavibacteriaceae bacterium]|nr:hypothetical protein [Ignavibacteriaceae bacterium]